jgi:hypothetical protein
MCVHAKTMAADKGGFSTLDLTIFSFASKLADSLNNVQHTATIGFSQKPAAGVYGQAPTWADTPVFNERPSLSFCAEAIRFKLHEHHDSETIV